MSGSGRIRTAFKWISIAVVVTIAALAALVGLPAYQDYTARARVLGGLSLAAEAQTAVEKNAAAGENDLSAGWKPPAPTEAVNSIAIDALNGTISISYTSAAGGPGNVVLVPNAPSGTILAAGQRVTTEIVWLCDKAATTLPPRYRPARCR
jgi:type IV pilus assembly protein PilA